MVIEVRSEYNEAILFETIQAVELIESQEYK